EELKLSLERHQIIIDQTNDIVFEWDLQKDSIYFSNNWKKLFGYEPITKDININFFENLRIHKDDLQGFYDMITVVLNGGKYLDHECRLQKQDGQYIWVKIKLTIQQDENKKPIKGVGVIININDSKNESLRLIKEAQIDSLTQVYNKMTAETLIKNYFKEMTNEELCALLILDADYFKKINDENGHYFGDLFIKEAAKAIKSTVKDIDIVGRMGGDEFIILLKNIFINDYSWQKAEEILKAFRKIRVKTSTGQILQQREYSCSIGIAIYNDKSITFEEIYKKADSALYKAKEKGRNCFYICN
ncbi:MAG: sensor domain-containing diguanylate cyclase, partial [Oscillospiraceae bacterium]